MYFESIFYDFKLIVNFWAIILILSIKESEVSPRIYKPMNSNTLRDALRLAKSTDIIRVKAGYYSGGFTVSSSGSLRYPITLTGPSNAVITCNARKGAAIHLKNKKYWNISGITIANCQKGLLLERSSHINIGNVKIKNMQEHAIHISKFSTHNIVKNSKIKDTAKNGNISSQAIAIGSDFRFWVNNNPDKSNFNQIEGNAITSTNGILIDIKEGSCCNSIIDNQLDGSGMRRLNESLIRVKGNSNKILRNTGRVAPKYGIIVSTNRKVNLGGCNNIIKQNECDLQTKEDCIKILNKDLCNNIIDDNNDDNNDNTEEQTQT